MIRAQAHMLDNYSSYPEGFLGPRCYPIKINLKIYGAPRCLTHICISPAWCWWKESCRLLFCGEFFPGMLLNEQDLAVIGLQERTQAWELNSWWAQAGLSTLSEHQQRPWEDSMALVWEDLGVGIDDCGSQPSQNTHFIVSWLPSSCCQMCPTFC